MGGVLAWVAFLLGKYDNMASFGGVGGRLACGWCVCINGVPAWVA